MRGSSSSLPSPHDHCCKTYARDWIRLLTFLSASLILLIGLHDDGSSSSSSSGKRSGFSPFRAFGGAAGISSSSKVSAQLGNIANGGAQSKSNCAFSSLPGDGMVSTHPLLPLFVTSPPPLTKGMLLCDRVGGDPEERRAPPEYFTTPVKELTWLGAKGATWKSSFSLREIHRFTAERAHIADIFAPAIDIPHLEHLHVMSPALIWTGDRYLTFLRVSNYPDELYDNFLWVQEFTPNLEPIPDSGNVVGIPTHSAPLMAPGPEDPRAIIVGGELFIMFNLQFRNNDRRMVLYNHNTKRLVVLLVEGLTFQRAEKNWMPFVFENKLHFLYQLDPLVVVSCDTTSGQCTCVIPACKGNTYNTRTALARGGSGLTPLSNVILPQGGSTGIENLYFGLIHATFGNNRVGDHAIRGHLILFSAAPTWGVVAMSSSIELPKALKECYKDTVPWDVQFPASFALMPGGGGGGGGSTSARYAMLGIHVRDAMASLMVADMQEPLSKLLEQASSLCLTRGANGACSSWKILGDGEVDKTLNSLLVE